MSRVKAIGKSEESPLQVMINKAEQVLSVQEDETAILGGEDSVIYPTYPPRELRRLVTHSTILLQCVEAYKRNILGFGAKPKSLLDDSQQQPPEGEMKVIKDFIRYFNFDMSFEDVMGKALEDREATGNGFVEILRNGAGQVEGGEYVDGVTMFLTKLTPAISVETRIGERTFKRLKRFRKYIQVIGGTKIWFKELGDPRIMDSTTGLYEGDVNLKGEAIPPERQANEILHLKAFGNGVYGDPRWIGALICVYGARKAEELNYRYFTQGRHTPMAILLHNAKLSPESEAALEDYAKSIEGVEQAHKFLLIEAEGEEEGILQDEKKNARVELKSLADMLQQDALFLEYDDKSREKVQSTFRLPDLYIGRSKDFNRATADMARQVTEEQVFEPERNSLEWIFNNKLLMEYGITDAGIELGKPEIANTEDMTKMIDSLGRLNVFAPNDLRELAGKTIGKELKPLEGEEFDKPASQKPDMVGPDGTPLKKDPLTGATIMPGAAATPKTDQTVQKGYYYSDDIVDVLKDVRDAVEELKEGAH